MRGLKLLLTEEMDRLEGIISAAEKRMDDAPEGSLHVSKCASKFQFYRITKENEAKKRTYIGKESGDLIQKLAQKSYDEKVLKLAKKRLAQMSNLAYKYEDDEFEKLYEKEHPEKKKIIKPVEEPWDAFLEKWEAELYQGKEFMDSATYILTEKGEKVRSKSEKIIADYLLKKGISYKYERPLHLKGLGIVYPDFTLISPATRKEVYWEHCGMMDNPTYSAAAVRKIHTYEKNGIFLGERLILTFETEKISLETVLLEKIVEKYFVIK